MIQPSNLTEGRLKADLHIHSSLSPCGSDEMVPPAVLDKLVNLGIKVFSITDHNSGLNCSAFEQASQARGLIFIPGIELQSSEEVHLLGYFPTVAALEGFQEAVVDPGLIPGMKNDPGRFGNQRKVNKDGKFLKEVEEMLSMPLMQSLNELVDAVHEHGGLAVAAHLDRGFSVIAQLGFMPPDLKVDAVEIKDVTKIEKFKQDHLKDREFVILSSSDSHHLDNLQTPKMRFQVEKGDVSGVLGCIKGEGGGRVIIKQKRPNIAANKPVSPGTGSQKDFKSLYGR